MRVEEGHDDGEALVGRAEHADAAIGHGEIFDEPVDGVVGVGGVVGAGGVEAAVHGWRRHEVGAFGAVFAADVLVDADVAGFDEDLVAEIELVEHAGGVFMGRGAVCSGGGRSRTDAGGGAIGCGACGCVVGCAGEDDRRVGGGFGDDDDGVELDAVAHGDHLDALDVVEAGLGGDGVRRRGRGEGVGDVVGDGLFLRGGGESAKNESKPGECSTAERDHLAFLGPRGADDGGGRNYSIARGAERVRQMAGLSGLRRWRRDFCAWSRCARGRIRRFL